MKSGFHFMRQKLKLGQTIKIKNGGKYTYNYQHEHNGMHELSALFQVYNHKILQINTYEDTGQAAPSCFGPVAETHYADKPQNSVQQKQQKLRVSRKCCPLIGWRTPNKTARDKHID